MKTKLILAVTCLVAILFVTFGKNSYERRQKMRIPKMLTLGLVIVALTFVGTWAYAQETPPTEPAKSKWEFDLVPYFWMAGLSGDMTVRGVPLSVSESFSDILSNLDFGAQLHMEAHKGRWGIFLDGTYLSLSSNGDATRVRSGPRGRLELTTQVNVDVDITEWLVEFGGTYNAARWPLGTGGSALALDILGGGRYWYVKTDVDVGINQTLGDFGRYLSSSISVTKDWIDPFVGARLIFDLPKNFMVVLRSDVGGFDVGSKISWNLAGYVGYNISRVVSLWAGYRALYVDYESGSGTDKFVFDTWMYGPAIGIGFRF
jgi:hypothetical protein